MRFAPKRLAKLAIKQVGANECIVYGGSKGIIPILNDTARLVLTMCNGVRTVQEIAREVETSYELTNSVVVVRDVTTIIEEFLRLGLLEETSEKQTHGYNTQNPTVQARGAVETKNRKGVSEK